LAGTESIVVIRIARNPPAALHRRQNSEARAKWGSTSPQPSLWQLPLAELVHALALEGTVALL
jgi:hypothetical protein